MQNAAYDLIVEHLEAGRDVRIEGETASAQLDAAAARLDDSCNVVRLTAPHGGLSLSALIAQLSGRERFDDQDDGALEIGFRRLCGFDTPDRRTVLLLDATHGVQRPVLRYLQQVGHNAPALLFAIATFPELTTLLGSPDMLRLRERLETVVEAGATLATVTGATVAGATVPGRVWRVVPPAGLPVLPNDWMIESRRRASMRQQRRSRRVALMWGTSALAVLVATVVGAWLGQARMTTRGGTVAAQAKQLAPAVAAEPDRRVQFALAPAPVPVPARAPPLAARIAPATTPRAPTMPADPADPAVPAPVPMPALVKLTAPDMVAAGEPPAAVPAKPDTVSFASVEERLVAQTPRPRVSEAHRPTHPRLMARTRAPAVGPSASSRFAEDGRPLPNYQVEDLPPDEPEPAPGPRRFRGRVARVPTSGDPDSFSREATRPNVETDSSGPASRPPSDSAYIGTYSTGPYGARVFRYGP